MCWGLPIPERQTWRSCPPGDGGESWESYSGNRLFLGIVLTTLSICIWVRLFVAGVNRETSDGCPLLTAEAVANGDLWSTNEWRPSLVGSLESSCRYTRFCLVLAALVNPVKNIFFPYRTQPYCNLMWPHCPATWEGSRAGSPLSDCVSLDLMAGRRSTCVALFCRRSSVWGGGRWGIYFSVLHYAGCPQLKGAWNFFFFWNYSTVAEKTLSWQLSPKKCYNRRTKN